MSTRCLEPHCSPDGRSTKDWDASATRSSCLADVYNLGGFLTRKRPSPNLTLAEAYYRTALAHHPHHCPTLGYLAELHLTTADATAANATALELCAACGGGAALPARQARAAFEASGVAWPSRGACAPSTETVVFTLAASGSVSDYSDTSSLRQAVATAAGVDKSLVTIEVTAASVIITATIRVPASTTADEMKTSLSSSLGTADAASTALGITVEEAPTITSFHSHSHPPHSHSTNVAAFAIAIAALAGLVTGCIVTILAVVVRMRASKSKRAKKDSVVRDSVVHLTVNPDATRGAAPPIEPPDVRVTVSDSNEGAAPANLAALLAACGLAQRTSPFEAEGYTLESLLGAMKQGDEAAMRDLRELKLNLGESRKVIAQLKKNIKYY